MTGKTKKFFVYVTLTLLGLLFGFFFGGMNLMSSEYSSPLRNDDSSPMSVPAPKHWNSGESRAVSTALDGSNGEINSPALRDKMAMKTSRGQTRSALKGTHKNITKIIIITYRRSGSSFFAELFRQNPNIFYMFEPLKAVEDRYDIDTPIAGPAFLKEIMNCHFGKNSFISQAKSMHHWKWQVIFRDVYKIANVPMICVNKSVVVSKIIRLATIAQLAPFFGEDTAILFLARDPRGILNSRNHETVGYKRLALQLKKNDMESLCHNSLTNINFIKNLNARRKELGLRPFIMQVQYEDFAYDTLEKANELYKTLNIPFHDSVRDWIGSNTSKVSHRTYGTSRNSTSIPRKWRAQLPPVELNMVQNIPDCAKVIQSLGFDIVKDMRLTL